MQTVTKSRAQLALNFESLEGRRLRAGVVSPLAQGVGVEVAGNPYDPTADLSYAHDLGLSGAGQTVAIIDSGIAYDHFALGGGLGTSYRVVGGWDFAENDADPYDDGPLGYHGTHVAGIVGSSHEEVLGVAPGADLVALRVFGDAGQGDFDWIESALAWVHDHRDSFEYPVTTVNLSIGSSVNSETIPDWTNLEDELETLADDGIFVSVAAGNGFREHGVAGLNYPAASPFVTPVSSVDESGQLSSFSQRHQRALAAPGELVNSTVPDYLYGFDGVTDDFARVSGTSMAAPYVAGASVLVREAFAEVGRTDITAAAIHDHLFDTADTISDIDTDADYRRLNLRAALSSILAVPNEPLGTSAIFNSLGTTNTATFSSTGNEWFEFSAPKTAVLLIDGQAPDDVSSVVVMEGQQRVDGEVSTVYGDSELRFVTVQKGQTYRIHVSDAVQQISLRPLVSLDGDALQVHGDHATDDLYAAIGSSFAVAARGIRQQVSTGGRLDDDHALADVDVDRTGRGLVVRIGTGNSGGMDVNQNVESGGDARIGPQRQSQAVLPFAPIDVGAFSNSDAVDWTQWEQATDGVFAHPGPDDQTEIPVPVLDEIHSAARRTNSTLRDESDIASFASATTEGKVVDQVWGEQLVSLRD